VWGLRLTLLLFKVAEGEATDLQKELETLQESFEDELAHEQRKLKALQAKVRLLEHVVLHTHSLLGGLTLLLL